ncbi:MAG: S1 family peptidase [Coriobacteriales bacterium]|nr:S1 family peptidase [Coriobacteriales bacterium]
MENELLSLSAQDKLRQSFIARKDPQPAMFGSVYLDDDGILVVNVADDDPQLIKEVNEALRGEKYHIKNVAYPWASLEAIRDIMNAKLMQKKDDALSDNFVGFYLDDRDNRIVVELLDIGEKALSLFKKCIMDSPALVFRKAIGRCEFTANVNCGSGMTSSSSGISVGYRVKKSSTLNYIVTAGHGFSSTGTSAKACIGGTEVGYCTARAMSNCDAALVAIQNPNYTAVNTLNYSTAYSLGTLVTAATVGATITKEGVTTQITSRTCTSTNFTGNFTTGTITDLILVERPTGNPMAQPGDSGGVTYSTARTTVGITTAYLGTTNVGIFSKASNINSSFSTSRY